MIQGWHTYLLSELLTIKNGKDHKALAEGKYPVIGSGGIMRYVDSFLYNKPSILLPRKGTLDNIQFCDTPFWTVDTLYYTEVKDSLTHPYYLYWYLRMLDLSKLDSGTGVPSMTFESYYNIKVNLPPLSVQRKIGTLLSDIDRKIALNRRMNATLEAMARQLYDYWFLQFDFPDAHGKPYKSSGGKMTWNNQLKRDIPEGWDSCLLKDLLVIKNGRDHKHLGNGIFPVYGTGGKMREVDKYLYSGESVLMPRKGSLNNVLFVDEAFWTVDTMFYSELKLPYCAKFIFFSIRDIDFTRWDSGTGVPSMTSSTLYSIPLVKPQSDILKRFDDIATMLFKTKKQVMSEISTLTRLRSTLLPLLMNGQVSVEGPAA